MRVGLGRASLYGAAVPWLWSYRILRQIGGKLPSGGFRALLFHDIPQTRYRTLERVLEYVARVHGVLRPEEVGRRLIEQGQNALDHRVPCLLTFDDGLRSQLFAAREVLDRYGLKAIFFVCPGLVDVPAEHQGEAVSQFLFNGAAHDCRSVEGRYFMSWSDLATLLDSGHAVGAHTVWHRRLSALPPDRKAEEVLGAAARLEARLGVPVRWFAYPFGDVGSIDVQALKTIAVRYEYCCSGIRGLNQAGAHPLTLLREQVDVLRSVAYQLLAAEGGLDFRYKHQVRHLREMVETAATDATT